MQLSMASCTIMDPKHSNWKRAVVPKQFRKQTLEEVHSDLFGGHFSGQRVYNTLMLDWWWEVMFSDAIKFTKACPNVHSPGMGNLRSAVEYYVYLFFFCCRGTWRKTHIMMISCVLHKIEQVWMDGTEHSTTKNYIACVCNHT